MPSPAKHVRFGAFEVDTNSGELRKDGIKLKLQGQPIEVLAALLESPGEVVTRDELRHRLWPSDTFVDFEHNLNSAVKRLREALGDSADHPHFVETLPRHGYRFIHPVQSQEPQTLETGSRLESLNPLPPAVRENILHFPEEESQGVEPHIGKGVRAGMDYRLVSHSRRNRTVGLVAIGFVALLVVSATLYVHRRTEPVFDSVAVLPFTNVGGDIHAEYLSDGITECLMASLAHVPELKVKSRHSVFRYKGKEVDVRQIGSELGVSTLVSGRVLQRGEIIEIRAELTNTKDNTEIWGQRYSGRSSELVLLQQQMAGDLADRLRARLSGSQKRRITTQGTSSAEAYGLYLKGRYHWNKRTPGDISTAISHFHEAISRDPHYAQAYSGLADAYAVLAAYGSTDSPTELAAKSNAAARKALELDPSLARAHTVLANNAAEYYWNFAEGEAEYKKALALDPNDAITHAWYATDLGYIGGREQEAINEALRAQQLDPLEPIITDLLGGVYVSTRHFDEALRVCSKLANDNPSFAPVHKDCLAPAYWAKRMYPHVIREWRVYGDLSGDNREATFAFAVEQGFRVSGWKGALRRGIAARQTQRNAGFLSPYIIAQLYADLGEREQTFRWLTIAFQEHDWNLEALKTDFVFDPLRSDLRFDELIHRVGLPQ